MRLGIALSYLNGAKEFPRCLKPWIPHVSTVAAINGRYKTPQSPEMKAANTPTFSTDDSFSVLKDICGEKLIHEDYYATQMDKRQRCFDLLEDCDFAIVFDTDDYIHPEYTNWDKFKGQLQSVLKYWDDQIFFMNAWIPDEKLYPRQHNEGIPSNSWKKYVRIHRNPGEMRYTKNHFTWAKKDTTDKQINEWNWNPDNWFYNKDVGQKMPKTNNPYILEANILIDGIRFTTDRIFRTQDDITFGDGWAWQNLHWETYNHDFLPSAHAVGLTAGLEDYDYFFDENGKRVCYNNNGEIMSTKERDNLLYFEDKWHRTHTKLITAITS